MAKVLIRHVLSAEELQTVVGFGVEVERLWITPVQRQGDECTILKVENHFDGSPAEHCQPPQLVGQTVTSPTDDALAALQRQFRVFILVEERTHLLSVHKTKKHLSQQIARQTR